jgi:hypothetical protein
MCCPGGGLLQERQLLAEGTSGWQQSYYMPGTSDTGVAAWRSWLSKFGQAMPVLPRKLEDLPPLMDRRQSLDRYSQHTAHCPDCQKVGSPAAVITYCVRLLTVGVG